MKETYKIFGTMLFAAVAATSCVDDDALAFDVEKPQSIAQYEYLNAYSPLKEYYAASRAGNPDFKVSGALTASEFSEKGFLYRLAAHNFDEVVAGNAMKMASCVNEYGDMNFDNVTAFVNAAEDAGVTIYGHTLAWHAQQSKWLTRILKDKELDIDPNAKEEKEDYTLDYVGVAKFPYYVMGYEPEMVDDCIHSTNPGSWYQYFIADGFQIPKEGAITAIVTCKGSVANDGLTLNCGWGWGSGESASSKLPISTDWQDQVVNFTGVPSGKKLNLVLQPGGYDGTLDIKSIRVVHYESPAVEVAINDYDYSFKNDTKFPYYVMGYEPTIENGCLHSTNPGSWYQYFIADNIPHPVEGTYVATVKVKGSVEADLTLNMGWGWGSGEQASGKLHVSPEWKEVKVTYLNIPDKSCNLVLQPGGYDGTIDIEWVKVDHIVKMNTIPLTPQERKDTLLYAMDKWIGGMMEATEGKVKAWDVVNEAISGGGNVDGFYALQHTNADTKDDFFWQDEDKLGDLDYVRTAVACARKHFKGEPQDLKLFVNDYNLESTWDDNHKVKSLVYWIGKWEADGVTKIDGIGTQMHISLAYGDNEKAVAENESRKAHIENMFRIMADSKKLCRVSELDLGVDTFDVAQNKFVGVKTEYIESLPLEQRLAIEKAQADYYQWIISKYFEIIPVAQQYGICQWCLTDAPSNSGWRGGEPVGLWNLNYQRKPAYAGWAEGLKGLK